jgi:hypothetical protein
MVVRVFQAKRFPFARLRLSRGSDAGGPLFLFAARPWRRIAKTNPSCSYRFDSACRF